MRIVHIEDRFEPQSGYQVNEMIKEHVENGHEVIIIASNDPVFSKPSELYEGDKILWEKHKIKVIRIPHITVISARYLYKNLFKTVEDLKPEIVFMHGIGDFKDLILFRKKRKYIIVRDSHMSWVASKNRFNKIYYKIFRKTIAKIINNTDKYYCIYSLGEEETQYLEALGIKREKIKPLLHGYNKKDMFFSIEEREKLRKELGYKKEDICIAYVGKFDDNKAPHYLFNILNNIEENYFKENNIKVLFMGPKEINYHNKFNELIKEFKYKDYCKILTSKKYNELYKYYSALDIVIWPKECTLSAIHAQVCGCSVLMEKHLSNIERVYKKENLFDINNFKQASRILRKIIDNKEFLKENKEKQINFFKNREYTNQIKELEKDWIKKY